MFGGLVERTTSNRELSRYSVVPAATFCGFGADLPIRIARGAGTVMTGETSGGCACWTLPKRNTKGLCATPSISRGGQGVRLGGGGRGLRFQQLQLHAR